MRNGEVVSSTGAQRRTALLLIDVINDMDFEGPSINDNFGKWRSDLRTLVQHCVNDDVPGREVARQLKPKPSAFFGTTLDTLLRNLGSEAVILTGIAGDNCVLFSANDAYMRELRLYIPSDCVASNTEENHLP